MYRKPRASRRGPAPGSRNGVSQKRQPAVSQVISSFRDSVLKRPSHERRAWRSSEPWRRGQEMPMPVYRGRAYLILTYPPSEKCSLTSAQTRYAGSRPYPDRCTRRWTSRFGRSCFCGFGTIPCGQWSHTRNSSWKGMLRSGTSSITANSSFTISRQHHQHKTASPTSGVEQPVWRTWQVTVEYSLPL